MPAARAGGSAWRSDPRRRSARVTKSSSVRHAVVVLGVRDRGVEQLQRPSSAAPRLTEPQDLARLGDVECRRIRREDLADLVGERPGGAQCARRSRAISDDSTSLLAGVVPERAGGRELAELVTDHRLGDVHRARACGRRAPRWCARPCPGVMRRSARPRLDRPCGRPASFMALDLLLQVLVDERALLQAARRMRLPPGACGHGGGGR